MINIGVNPVALQIGSLSIRWYGLFIAMGVFWLIAWMWWQVRKGAKLTIDTVLTLALVGVPAGVIISRLLHVVDNTVIARMHPELVLSGSVIDYLANPSLIIGGEGLTAYGAVLGAALGIWLYCRIAKVKIGYTFDLLAPGVIMAQAIGRLGCLFNGCCYGVNTTLPWGLNYTNQASLGRDAGVTQPTVVYEIFFNVLAFGVLFKLRNKFTTAGSLFALYLALYAVWRLGIDFIRAGQPFLFGLHQAQVISIVVLLITIPWMVINTRLAKKTLAIEPVPVPTEQN